MLGAIGLCEQDLDHLKWSFIVWKHNSLEVVQHEAKIP